MRSSEQFWNKIYIDNAPRMLGICRRYISDPNIAEDVMHDAFLQAIKKQESFKGKGRFEAWLRKITVNTALMHNRNKKTSFVDAELIKDENTIINQSDESPSNYQRKIIEQAQFSNTELLQIIDKLPSHHKAVFNLYIFEKLSHFEISNHLGISVGTSKSHLSRARKKLKQLLYTQAIEKNNKKKKRAGIFLFLFTSNNKYIDHLFQKKLAKYTSDPSNNNFQSNAMEWNKISLPFSQTGSLIGRLGIQIISVFLGASAIIYGVYYHNNNQKDETIFSDPYIDSIPKELNVSPYKNEFLDTISSQNTISNPGNTNIENQPVVIRKTIVQKKKIIVRDTIQTQP